VETIVMNEQLHQGQRTAGVIRFDRPASVWEEAYPIGNGKLGAMVFGDPRRERLALNEDSVWYAKGNAYPDQLGVVHAYTIGEARGKIGRSGRRKVGRKRCT
jgi:hypothetical protein